MFGYRIVSPKSCYANKGLLPHYFGSQRIITNYGDPFSSGQNTTWKAWFTSRYRIILGKKTLIASYQMWGWKGISSQPLFQCMIPIATKKNALPLPRRDSITLRCPDTMPEIYKVKQSTWTVGKRTLHLSTFFHIKLTWTHACWNWGANKSCDRVLKHDQIRKFRIDYSKLWCNPS